MTEFSQMLIADNNLISVDINKLKVQVANRGVRLWGVGCVSIYPNRKLK